MLKTKKPKQLRIPSDLLVQFRQVIHKFPELSGEEEKTRERIINFLRSYTPTKILDNLGGKSLALVYGSDNSDTTILVRCELDALPIQELNDVPYKSQHEGVAHLCGHDGHMAILTGLGTVLRSSRPKNTRVVLLFQHAEEIGDGARDVLNDPAFEEIQPDYAIALHNVPNYPLGQVIVKSGSFTPAVISMDIHLDGKTSHAAEPEMGFNPGMAISRIISAANKLENNVDNEDLRLLTLIHIDLGEEAYGTSAGHAQIQFTLRAATDEQLDALKEQFSKEITGICKKEQLTYSVDWKQPFSANENNPEVTQHVKDAAQILEMDVLEKESPFKWGEDFGLFTQKCNGVLFGLGSGENTPGLHNPDYDFPDELIDTGVKLFYQIIEQLSTK